MANTLITEVSRLALHGYHPVGVVLRQRDRYTWDALVSLHDFYHPAEGYRLDAKGLPKGVQVGGWERVPDHGFLVSGEEDAIKSLLLEFANFAQAEDVARFEYDQVEWICKPSRWFNPLAQLDQPSDQEREERKKAGYYYNRSLGRFIKRPPENSARRAGKRQGRKQRNKDKVRGVYPRESLPLERNRPSQWIDGYQSSYYQGAAF